MGATELLFGPIDRRFQPRRRDKRGLFAQHAPPAFAERQRIDVLDGLAACHFTVLTPSPPRCAQVFPVRRLIARPSKALLVDEGLQEHRLVSVPLEPILAKSTHAERQDFRGQVGHRNPGRNQEARVRYHVTQVGRAGSLTPANPLIACRNVPCRRTESERPHPSSLTPDQVAHLRAHQWTRPQVVMRHQALPRLVQLALEARHQDHPQPTQLCQRAKDRIFAAVKAARHLLGAWHLTLRLGQLDQATTMQSQKRDATTDLLGLTIGTLPIQPGTHAAETARTGSSPDGRVPRC